MNSKTTRYRSNPVEVDAWRFMPDDPNKPEWVDLGWFHEEIVPEPMGNRRRGSPIMIVPTNHGPTTARIGDWIIRNSTGEVYPCSDSIFTEKYRPAEADELVYHACKLVPYEERWFKTRSLVDSLGYKLMATYRLVSRE